MKAWHGGKGSITRRTQIARDEMELRDALWRERDLTKKQEIKNKLDSLLKEKENAS